ncbi:hypothetical protein RIF29_29654 [Crotalaria pallida]|uniref:Reverse transcriptase zinc-binding domain-containing protein n=1 Tax=Crotalaria pallida TaxID=3830 RepID=A0AAN9EHA3_CROPI
MQMPTLHCWFALMDVCKDCSLQHVNFAIQKIQIPRYTQTPDVVRWNGNLEGVYTAASGYQWLGVESKGWGTAEKTSWIWRAKIPAKMQWIIWLISKDVLLVNVLRFHRGLSDSLGCPRCSATHETILHYLKDCPFAKEKGDLVAPWFMWLSLLY